MYAFCCSGCQQVPSSLAPELEEGFQISPIIIFYIGVYCPSFICEDVKTGNSEFFFQDWFKTNWYILICFSYIFFGTLFSSFQKFWGWGGGDLPPAMGLWGNSLAPNSLCSCFYSGEGSRTSKQAVCVSFCRSKMWPMIINSSRLHTTNSIPVLYLYFLKLFFLVSFSFRLLFIFFHYLVLFSALWFPLKI